MCSHVVVPALIQARTHVLRVCVLVKFLWRIEKIDIVTMYSDHTILHVPLFLFYFQLIDAHASEFTMSEWTFCVLVHQNPGHCLDQGDSSDSSSLLPTISTIVKLCLCMMREAGVMREAGEMWEGVKRVEPVQLDSQDLECSLCTALIFDPVTTVCGHSFCRSCLCRSFDHSPACPVCRTVLSEVSSELILIIIK